MRLKVGLLALVFVFSLHGYTEAHGHVPDTNKEQEWHMKMLEREQQLLSWVDQFTPEKKAEWSKVLEEKKKLRSKWMSPENAKKREQWKKERMKKIQELKKQLKEGKITKEQFVKEIHGGKGMADWTSFRELRAAIENKDEKSAKNILNRLLTHYKVHNEKLKEKLAE